MINATFTYGLCNDPLFRKLQGREFKNTEELLEKVNCFIRLESIGHEKNASDNKNRAARPVSSEKRNTFTSLPSPRSWAKKYQSRYGSQGSETYAASERKPNGWVKPERKFPRNPLNYCEFHKCYGHSTANCERLK